jgi:hypothetical protein
MSVVFFIWYRRMPISDQSPATQLLDSRVLLHMPLKIVRSCESLRRVLAGLNRTVQKLLLRKSFGMFGLDVTIAILTRWEAGAGTTGKCAFVEAIMSLHVTARKMC